MRDLPINSDDAGASSGLPFPVVGIGASAGGLAALVRILDHIPADTGMGFVVVLHLSPSHDSKLEAILQAHTRMRVQQVHGQVDIERNNVYVIPPGCDLAMVGGQLETKPATRDRGPHVAIDLFLRTLADVHRERAIGIVLSGTGSDGTLGLARIKERGGVTFAQAPTDSEHQDMPRNAIDSGRVDFVLPAVEIPQQLLRLWENAAQIALPITHGDPPIAFADEDPRAEAEAALQEILQLLYARTGHDFSNYKRATVLRRIKRRLQVRTLRDVPAYRDFLREEPRETPALLDDMLISVTNFFRDRESFEALEREVVPRMVARYSGTEQMRGEQIRVWVPGCATGEEAYSIAMLLHEAAAHHATAEPTGAARFLPATPPNFHVFATDIDEPALAIARRGAYPASIANDMAPARLRDFFSRTEDGYVVTKALRECVTFATQNVLRDPPFSRLDIVSCRNLLIYLRRDIQSRLLDVFHFALRPGGVLFLGGAESIEAGKAQFEPIDQKHRLFRTSAAPTAFRRSPVMPLSLKEVGPAGPQPLTAGRFSFANVHQGALEQYAPPSLVIDGAGTIVHMSEHAGRFLRHDAGEPTLNLLRTVHPALRAELRSAVLQAVQSGKSVQSRTVRMPRGDHGESPVHINMYARPFTNREARSEFVLVLFEESEQLQSDAPVQVSASSEQHVMKQLEHELQSARDQLSSTMESSQAESEELRASNEELQAANEELRSASEELETSSDELQSLNAELLQANAALKRRAEEVHRVNDDLNNFIAATAIPALFVDESLRILRYTPSASTLFVLGPTDLGRSLLKLEHRLDYPMLGEDITAVIASGQTIEREIASSDGAARYAARTLPYLTASETQPRGAVLTLVDITRLRSAEERATQGEIDMRNALAQSHDFAVVSMDADGTISGWNSGAQAVFGYTQADIAGKNIRDLFTPEDRAAGAPEHEMETARTHGRAPDERWHLRQDGSRVFCSGVMTPVDISGKLEGYVKMARDATQQREALQNSKEQLTRARKESAEARAGAAMKDEFLAVMSHELKHPLNLITVNAELIARTPDLALHRSPIAMRALGTITRAVRAQARIVDDLLDLSRVRTGKLALDLTVVDLVPVAQAALESARADPAAAALRFNLQFADKAVHVLADAARLNQIVWNLLSNAIKFTEADGQISIIISVDGGCGRLDVVDTGLGIDPETLPGLFEMFGQGELRATSHQRGLGIGLALVRQLVEHHDGRVEAYSAGRGHGARFSVWLPLYQARALADPAGRPSATSGKRCAGLRVLLVDDDPQTVDALGTLLQLEGADVATATNAMDVLRHLDTLAFDVVLTDIGMPDIDGFELLRRIRNREDGSTLPVIALTGFGRDKDVERAVAAGFDAHIAKPVVIDDLLQRLQGYVRSR